MDDFKYFANNKSEQNIQANVRKEFGIEKYALQLMNKRETEKTEVIELAKQETLSWRLNKWMNRKRRHLRRREK